MVQLLAWLAREEVVHGKSDVFRNLAQQCRRDIAPLMKGHGRATTVGVPKLSVRSALPDFGKPQLPEKRHDLAGLQDGWLRHGLRHFDRLRSDEHALQPRVSLLEQHLDHFLKVGAKFVQRFTLAVSAREAWDPAHVKASVSVPLDDGRKVLHDEASLLRTIPEAVRGLQRPNALTCRDWLVPSCVFVPAFFRMTGL